MLDRVAFSDFICPFMSSWNGTKHCSYKCRFHDIETEDCILSIYIRSQIKTVKDK